MLYASLSVGKATSPATSHVDELDETYVGQEIAELVGVYALACSVPVGLIVDHADIKLEKSGVTGVGVPERTIEAGTAVLRASVLPPYVISP